MVPSPVSFTPSHGDDVPSYEMTWNRIVEDRVRRGVPVPENLRRTFDLVLA